MPDSSLIFEEDSLKLDENLRSCEKCNNQYDYLEKRQCSNCIIIQKKNLCKNCIKLEKVCITISYLIFIITMKYFI